MRLLLWNEDVGVTAIVAVDVIDEFESAAPFVHAQQIEIGGTDEIDWCLVAVKITTNFRDVSKALDPRYLFGRPRPGPGRGFCRRLLLCRCFLGRLARNTPRKTTSKKKVKKKPVKASPVIVATPWPEIEYRGRIGNNDRRFIAMVKIKGVEKILKVGDEIQGIKLNRIFRDSIYVAFNKEKKTITK